MEQRRLRLGDTLDDYCPRERRVTNHAIVAMVGENVKQTRCTTCDAEHAYKGGKEPRRRKKDAGSVLYQEVLAGMPEPIEAVHPEPTPGPTVVEPIAATENNADVASAIVDEGQAEVPVTPNPDEERVDGDDGPFHRRLIRATLPRPEGQKDVRQIPEFTIRQNGRGNGQSFRGGSKMRGHGGNGHRPQGTGGRRFGSSPGSGRGPMTGSGRGPQGGPGRDPSTGSGRGGGMPGMRSGRNRKRSR
jgi:hypothetical protein